MTIKQLLPKAVRESLPKLGSTSEEEKPIARVTFFYPDFGWTWYGIEFEKSSARSGSPSLWKSAGSWGLRLNAICIFSPRPSAVYCESGHR